MSNTCAVLAGKGRRTYGLVLRALVALLAANLSECFGPFALHHSLPQYDRNYLDTEETLLLLNIARVAYGEPPHFMVLSSISENVEFTSIATLQLTVPTANTANTFQAGPFTAGSSEKPLFTIIPVQGEDFAKRFESTLTDKLEYFIWQHGEEWIPTLRLMADGFLGLNPPTDNECKWGDYWKNDGTHKFDEVLDELGKNTNVENLERTVATYTLQPLAARSTHAAKTRKSTVASAAPLTPTNYLEALKEGYRWEQRGNTFYLMTDKPSLQMPAIINVPLSVIEQKSDYIWRCAQPDPGDFIYVELKLPNHQYRSGYLKIRNFTEILRFLALRGQAKRLIDFGSKVPPGTEHSVSYRGEWFWIPNTPEAQQAFVILYRIYQLTLVDISKLIAPPAITISK